MANAITTKHGLDFLMKKWEHPLAPENPEGVTMEFSVGTCRGQFFHSKEGLKIISINNDVPNNGHLEDVFQWFEFAAKQEGVDLYILDFYNERFKKHCIEKRGFKKSGTRNVMKKLKDIKIKSQTSLNS